MDCCHTETNNGHHSHGRSSGDLPHDKHEGHRASDFMNKFWLSLALTAIVVLFTDGYYDLLLGSAVFFYGGWVFIASAYREVRARLPGMMTLIALAISAAYAWSVYAVFVDEEALFWELTTLITIMLLGHWLEMRAVSGAKGALKELSKLLPDEAEVIRSGQSVFISLSELKVDDIVVVRPGSKIAADGEIIEGQSDVNESMITGESKPVSKSVGSTVIAGTINGDGALKVKVTQIGEHTFLAGVMRLVAEAQASKSRLQILSDRAAMYLTYAAVVGGAVTFAAWIIAGAETAFAVSRLVAVLVIACPHALGLAVPLIASISTTKAAQNGFLVKQRLALEAARSVDTVLFDKTGTLTTGILEVVSASSDETLALAASVDSRSEHPAAKAIVNESLRRGLKIEEATNYRRLPGVGGEAFLNGEKIFAGHRGGDSIVVEKNGIKIGEIRVADTPRREAKEAVEELKSMGVKVVMITGDSQEVAGAVSKQLGISEFFARVLPHQKTEKIKELQGRGEKVAMVGDGINDAPALTQADLGVAIGAGTNVAIESAGIILIKSDPRDIAKIIRLSRMTYAKMIQNLFWATGYNVAAMPIAAGALAFKGILLDPAIAAVLMSLSTVIVSLNALLLRNKQI